MIFSKKTPQQRRDTVAQQLAEAEAQRKRLILALAGQAPDLAGESDWQLAAKIGALKDALAVLDTEIAAAELAAAEAKISAERMRAAGYCNDLADRAAALAAGHEQWLLTENASVVNEYRKAIGHDPIDFRSELCAARATFNDLTTIKKQFRESAKRILAGGGDEEVQRMLAMAATK